MTTAITPEPPPAGINELPAFKKPVPTQPTPMSDWDPLFVQRRKEISEKILTVKSGRTLAYFTEGNPTDPAVLTLHSLGMSKTQFLFSKPLPGIFQISVDRQGHGNSSPYPPGSRVVCQFSDHVPEYVELLDSLGVDKFYVVGSSMGASWTIALAAALPDRCLGAAPLSALPDPWRANMTPALRKPLCPEGATILLSIGDSNCSGSMIRKLMASLFSVISDRTTDPDFAKLYNSYFKYGSPNSNKLAPDFELMDSRPFAVSAMLDARLYGGNCKNYGLVEQIRIFGKQGWGVDPANIKCPVFYYHPELDSEIPRACAEHFQRIIPHMQLIEWPKVGHATIVYHAEEIILALVQGKAVTPH